MATKKNTAIKRGDKEYNYYRITRTVGHEWKDGKKIPIKKQFTGTSKGNAEQKYKKYLENLHKEKENCIDNTKPLGDLMQYYADNVLSVDKKYAHGTRLRYLSSYNVHIKGADFTRKAASHVSAADIQIFYMESSRIKSHNSGPDEPQAEVFRYLRHIYRLAHFGAYSS